MNTTTVRVAYVNEPKSAGAPGNIKTDTGEVIKVWPTSKFPGGAILENFTAGRTYEIGYDTEIYQGKEKKVARKILSTSESQVTNGNSPHNHAAAFETSREDVNNRILWQVALKSAAQMLAGTGVPAADVIAFARELYAATPTESVATPETTEVEI